MNVAANLEILNDRIRAACAACQRAPDAVRLLAVSKTKPATDVLAAIAGGQADFGENYLQEALEKIDVIHAEGHRPTWHYIGAIQSNKTRPIASHFDWVHTVSSTKVARRLSEQREGPPLNVCLQVNISRDPAKAGVLPEAAGELVAATRELAGLNLRGLMTIPAASTDPVANRAAFDALAALRAELCEQYALEQFDDLSMGMSGDLVEAIAAGATWVRIGTALFGARHST